MFNFFKKLSSPKEPFVYLNNNASTLSPQCFADYLREHRCYSNIKDYYNNMVREDKDGIISRFKQELLKKCSITDSQFKVIITSSASESNNMLLKGFVYKFRAAVPSRLPNVLIGATEHKTSIYCVGELAALEYANVIKVYPDISTGIITMSEVRAAIAKAGLTVRNIDMVSLMAVNNETGIVTNISQIFAELKKENPNIFCHTDIVQSFGKCGVNLANLRDGRPGVIDAISISFHKLYGPIGCGAVVIRCSTLSRISPLIHGNQNSGMRGGTESVYLVELSNLGMQYNFENRAAKNNHVAYLYNLFCNINADRVVSYFKYKSGGVRIVRRGIYYVLFGDRENTLCNTLMMSIVAITDVPADHNIGADLSLATCVIGGAEVVAQLAKYDIIVSRGAMCSGDKESYVLTAHGIPKNLSSGGFRVSFGDINTVDDVYALSNALLDIINDAE